MGYQMESMSDIVPIDEVAVAWIVSRGAVAEE